ncbi:hypothetical protein PHJA_002185500 [Phtheirospermum japonicum]|uniref:Uncharacterized protein n=1 Tax=Phtheirospermum japonicum TaxID=374723 RepID=A0A830CW70_9LAMI|nr:hypothetical protein PHJA_002185500 [Phtheirospermum japonicum]
MFFVLQSIAGGRSQSTKALETLASVDLVNRQRHSTSYRHSVPSDEGYSIWIYKPSLPDFGVLVSILIVISLTVHRAVAADFTYARLCFALWSANTGNSPQIEYMNI